MNCPKCNREATYDTKFGSIKYYLCEFCNHKFGYIDDGQASQKEVDMVRRNYQQQYERHVTNSKPVREILSRAGIKTKSGNSVRMYSPERDRNVVATGTIRARK